MRFCDTYDALRVVLPLEHLPYQGSCFPAGKTESDDSTNLFLHSFRGRGEFVVVNFGHTDARDTGSQLPLQTSPRGVALVYDSIGMRLHYIQYVEDGFCCVERAGIA